MVLDLYAVEPSSNSVLQRHLLGRVPRPHSPERPRGAGLPGTAGTDPAAPADGRAGRPARDRAPRPSTGRGRGAGRGTTVEGPATSAASAGLGQRGRPRGRPRVAERPTGPVPATSTSSGPGTSSSSPRAQGQSTYEVDRRCRGGSPSEDTGASVAAARDPRLTLLTSAEPVTLSTAPRLSWSSPSSPHGKPFETTPQRSPRAHRQRPAAAIRAPGPGSSSRSLSSVAAAIAGPAWLYRRLTAAHRLPHHHRPARRPGHRGQRTGQRLLPSWSVTLVTHTLHPGPAHADPPRRSTRRSTRADSDLRRVTSVSRAPSVLGPAGAGRHLPAAAEPDAFGQTGIGTFLTRVEWRTDVQPARIGVLGLLIGTVLVALVASSSPSR